ncbi:MAG TPA: ATP-binding protein [Gaiellaceae bacterium]|jgi:signal transduction histidine kinase|nr:ATP-binding protein [Gaiellaceae bacterium]
MTEAGTHIGSDGPAPFSRSASAERPAHRGAEPRLERLHAYFLEGCTDEIRPVLEAVLTDARRVHAGYADDDVGDGLASVWYAATAIVELGAALELDEADMRGAGAAIAEACALPLPAARYVLFREVVGHPRLLELPPLLALELQLSLLIGLDALTDVSLWTRGASGLDCILALGAEARPSRRIRAEAKACLRRRSRLSLLGGSQLRSATVLRFGEAYAAVVGRVGGVEQKIAEAYLAEAAAALGPIIEREYLLEHSANRERTLTASSERRLMRLGFDLHDGPIQDVLALAADVQLLQQQVYPFILEDYREQASGRFDDLSARLVELDRQLREIAHSLETKSVLSRPLGEILHREVDTFAERSGVHAELEIRGDPDSLSSAQRITVFRAIQEALANIREHASATNVSVRVRARRSAIELQVVDDGMGFEVERALAKAAQRGRLGLVGIGERVRMVGGTFELESRPGGPTSLKITLPRWEPLNPS